MYRSFPFIKARTLNSRRTCPPLPRKAWGSPGMPVPLSDIGRPGRRPPHQLPRPPPGRRDGTARPDFAAPLARPVPLDQVAQPAQADLLAANERLAVAGADGPAPVTGPVAQVVQEGRRGGRPAGDELRAVAGHGTHLAVDVRGDVQHERRPGV